MDKLNLKQVPNTNIHLISHLLFIIIQIINPRNNNHINSHHLIHRLLKPDNIQCPNLLWNCHLRSTHETLLHQKILQSNNNSAHLLNFLHKEYHKRIKIKRFNKISKKIKINNLHLNYLHNIKRIFLVNRLSIRK